MCVTFYTVDDLRPGRCTGWNIRRFQTLKESCWRQEDQLWYAHDGFGCSPHAIGRSIRCTCLGDGEMTRWNRSDFVGVLKEEYLPDWALEKLDALRGQEQTDAPAMGGMTMK